MGFAQVVQLKPVEGDHKNVPFPVAVSVVLDGTQMETSGPAFAVGSGFTFTVAVEVLEQPAALVPQTV